MDPCGPHFGVPGPFSRQENVPIIFNIEGSAPDKGTVVWMGLEIYDEPSESYLLYPVFDSAEKALNYLMTKSSLKDAIDDEEGPFRSHDEEQVKKDLLAGKVYDRTYAVVSLTLP